MPAGVLRQRPRLVREPEGGRPAPHPEVRGQERVRIPQPAQGHVVGGPLPDAGKLPQPGQGLGPVPAQVEIQFSLRHRGGQGA